MMSLEDGHSGDATRAALLARVNAGDADALQQLLQQYHAQLHRAVERSIAPRLRRRLGVEDVLQDAYVAVFRALTAPEARGESPRSGADSDCETTADPVAASADPADDVPGAGRAAGPAGDTPAGPARHTPRALPRRFASPAAFYRWLEQVVLNEARDAQRAARRQKRDVGREVSERATWDTSCPNLLAQLSASGTTPSRALSRDETLAAVLIAMARLPQDQRVVVRLRFLEDVPVADIAARLGKSEMAVYTLCSRGLKALRQRMAFPGG